jgi:hypothetical protein
MARSNDAGMSVLDAIGNTPVVQLSRILPEGSADI